MTIAMFALFSVALVAVILSGTIERIIATNSISATHSVQEHAEDAGEGLHVIRLVVVLIALAIFAAASAVLTVTDAVIHRLPNVIIGYTAAAISALVVVVVLVGGPVHAAIRFFVAALACGTVLLVIALLMRGAIGGGDVKLAALVGGVSAWSSWSALLLTFVLAFVLAGLFAMTLVLIKRASKQSAIAFGPFLLAGCWMALILAPAI